MTAHSCHPERRQSRGEGPYVSGKLMMQLTGNPSLPAAGMAFSAASFAIAAVRSLGRPAPSHDDSDFDERMNFDEHMNEVKLWKSGPSGPR